MIFNVNFSIKVLPLPIIICIRLKSAQRSRFALCNAKKGSRRVAMRRASVLFDNAADQVVCQ